MSTYQLFYSLGISSEEPLYSPDKGSKILTRRFLVAYEGDKCSKCSILAT